MKIEVIRVVRAELEEEEFVVTCEALHSYAGGEGFTMANPKHRQMAAEMRERLMRAYHGEEEPQF